MSSQFHDPQEAARSEGFQFDFPSAQLRGRVVLVAGGTGGLGAALGELLLGEGAIPVLGYRSNEKRAIEVKVSLEARYGRKVHLVEGDIALAEARARYIEGASLLNGEIQGFTCFVGDPARFSFEDLSTEQVQGSFLANFTGPVLLAKQVAEHMISKRVGGSLVLVSSMQATALFPRSLAYAAPKNALIHACRLMAKQWSGPHNLRVNVVAPGATVAGMAASSVKSGKYDHFLESRSVSRFGRAEDVARAIRFLLEPDNYVTGQVLTVDGGLSLHA
ncbi:MAG: SDR family oxidoreductase [Acidobacteriota bacterium]